MDPSTATAAPSGKRRKQPKSCRLVRLPEPILFQILSYKDVLTPSNLGLCRALAPVTIKAFYRVVYLKSREQIKRFAWALCRHSERATLVLRLSLSDKEHTKDRPCAATWQPEREDSGSGQLVDFDPAASSSSVVVGIGLVKDILRLLVNLGSFHIAGVAIFAPLLQRDFLETLPYPSLSVLCLQAITGAHEVVPSSLIRSLAHVPSLKDVFLYGLDDVGLCNSLNTEPGVRVLARSLSIRRLCVQGSVQVGPELRILLQALSAGAKRVSIRSWWAYPSLMADVALLPPSLTHLTLTLGRGDCITADSGNKASSSAVRILQQELDRPTSKLIPDRLAVVKWSFPNLVSLVLQGELIPHSTCIPQPAIISAHKTGRPASARPVWRKDFGLGDAKALFEACAEKKVAVGRTIICATKMVYAGDGHLCRGWCQ